MGKDGKRRFFAYNIRHFYPIQKKTLEKIFVIEWYQILIINHKTDFSNILKSRVFDPYTAALIKTLLVALRNDETELSIELFKQMILNMCR